MIAASAVTISQAMAQQPTSPPLSEPDRIVGRTAAAIVAEGERKGTLQTYQDTKLVSEHPYYLWHDSCYIRYASGVFYSASIESCR